MRVLAWTILLFQLLLSVAAAQEFVVGIPDLKGQREPLTECETLIAEAYRRAGETVRFVYIPMLRDIAETTAQTFDASAGRTDVAVKGSDDLTLTKTPLLKTSLVAYAAWSHSRIHTWKDLQEHDVGYLRGDLTTKNLSRAGNIHMIAITSLQQGFDALRKGRLDAFVTHTTFLELADLSHLTRGLSASPPLYSGYFYHALNRKNAILADKLSDIFNTMLKDGTSLKLIGKYADLLPGPEWNRH